MNLVHTRKLHVAQKRVLLLFCFSWFLACIFSSVSAFITDSTQSLALQNLYDSTNGAGWNYTNLHQDLRLMGLSAFIGAPWFIQSQDPCSPARFSGVGCQCDAGSQKCVITGVVLPSANLKGPLPNSMGFLSDVTHLSLANNSITGSVAWDDLLLLTKLQILDLHNNPLTCQIPATISSLSGLQKLDLSSMQCSGSLPKELSLITGLKAILLYNNNFSGTVPVEWTSLVAAESIMLQKNKLFGGIPTFGATGMPKLRYLCLASNAFKNVIPESIGLGLIGLEHLDLSDNMLSGSVPSSLAKLSKLRRLSLSQNNLVSSVKSGFESCSNENGLKFIDPKTQTSLTDIAIGSNSFTGILDQDILALPKLEKFSAEGNCFCGTISESICSAKKLRTLVLDGLSSGKACRRHFFEGTAFYPTFSGYSSLQVSFGLLPQCIWLLPYINSIQASGNGLVGTIPLNISRSLQHVDLSNNHISGTIPLAAVRIAGFVMKNNRLSGDLAVYNDIQDLHTKETSIILNNNRLSGTIPQTFSSVQVGTVNILSGNNFACANSAELPVLDPSVSTYSCGSAYFNFTTYNFFGLFIGTVVLVGFVCLSRAYMARFAAFQEVCRVYSDEVILWFRVSNGSMTILLGETTDHDKNTEETMRSLTRYTHGLDRVRLLTTYLCILVCLIYFPVYTQLKGTARKLKHAYTWSTTAAYLTGLPTTVVITSCFIISLLLFRQLMLHDKELAARHLIELQKKNPNQPVLNDGRKSVFNFILPNASAEEPWHRRVGIPMLSLFLIFLLSAGTVALANIVYLYVYFRPYYFTIKSTAAVCLALFKMVWSNSGIPALIDSETLRMGVPKHVHKAFINNLVGGEICLKVYFSLGIGIIIPLLIAAFQSSACFFGAFIAPEPREKVVDVSACIEYNLANDCVKVSPAMYIYEVGDPFVYNYTCTSSILSAYVPMYIQVYTIMLAKGILRFLYLLYSVRKFRKDHDKEVTETLDNAEAPCQPDPTFNATLIAPVPIYDPDEEGNATQKKSWLDCARGYLNFGAASISLWLLDDQNTTGVSNSNLKSSVKSFTAAYIVSRLSTVKLLWSYDDRRDAYMALKPGELYETNLMDGAVGANSVLANYLGSVLILCTFGVVAPLLAVVITCSICVDTFISQITLGKFLTLEASVMLLHEHYLHTNPLLVRNRARQHLGGSYLADDGVLNTDAENSCHDQAISSAASLVAASDHGLDLSTPGKEALPSADAGNVIDSAAKTSVELRPRGGSDMSVLNRSRNGTVESVGSVDTSTGESIFGENSGTARMLVPSNIASPVSDVIMRSRGGSDMSLKSAISVKRKENNASYSEFFMRSRGGSDMSDSVRLRNGTIDFTALGTVGSGSQVSVHSNGADSFELNPQSIIGLEPVDPNMIKTKGSDVGDEVCMRRPAAPPSPLVSARSRAESSASMASITSSADKADQMRNVFTSEGGMARLAVPSVEEGFQRVRGVSIVSVISNSTDKAATIGSLISETTKEQNVFSTAAENRSRSGSIVSATSSIGSTMNPTGSVFNTENGMARIRVPVADACRSRATSFTSETNSVGESRRLRGPSLAKNDFGTANVEGFSEECGSRSRVSSISSSKSNSSNVNIRKRASSILDAFSGMREQVRTTFVFASSEQALAPVSEVGVAADFDDDIEMPPINATSFSVVNVDNNVGSEKAMFSSSHNHKFSEQLEILKENEENDNYESVDDTRQDTDYEPVVQPAMQEVLIDRSVYKPSVFFTLQVSNAYMESMVADAQMPWGSMAAVKAVIAECSALPSSVVNLTRRIIMFVASAFLSFVVNEVYNSEVSTSGEETTFFSRVPALIMLLFLPCVEIADYLFKIAHGPDLVKDLYVGVKKRVSLRRMEQKMCDTLNTT